jgi:hypothetical protein
MLTSPWFFAMFLSSLTSFKHSYKNWKPDTLFDRASGSFSNPVYAVKSLVAHTGCCRAISHVTRSSSKGSCLSINQALVGAKDCSATNSGGGSR